MANATKGTRELEFAQLSCPTSQPLRLLLRNTKAVLTLRIWHKWLPHCASQKSGIQKRPTTIQRSSCPTHTGTCANAKLCYLPGVP